MQEYYRTQIGLVTIIGLGGGALLCFGLALTVFQYHIYAALIPACISGLLLLCSLLFGSLTVEVTGEEVRLRFGAGLIRKRIPARRIRFARVVTNPVIYGWGIRRIPGGYLYNVSGLKAVELILDDDRIVRIGTSDAEELLAAVQRVAPGEV